MGKTAVLAAVVAALEAELEVAIREARAASDAATDPDSKAENKYDTRALEASYLARGQAQRVVELTDAVGAWRALVASSPAVVPAVAVGSLVTLGASSGDLVYCLGPAGGGTEVRFGGREITLVTPASPLGRQLLGKTAGETVALPGRAAWTVKSVR